MRFHSTYPEDSGLSNLSTTEASWLFTKRCGLNSIPLKRNPGANGQHGIYFAVYRKMWQGNSEKTIPVSGGKSRTETLIKLIQQMQRTYYWITSPIQLM